MRIRWFLRGGVDEARVRRRVLRLEILDRFEVARIGHDYGKFLELFELIQFCFVFFSSATAVLISFPPSVERMPEQRIDK